MEIERKFLVTTLPFNINTYKNVKIIQGYISIDPVIRIRKQNNECFLTYKSKGLLSREEYTVPLTLSSYNHLKTKVDYYLIEKTRYYIPLSSNLTAELDIFESRLQGFKMVEVEFKSENDANNFVPPQWFSKEVTYNAKYQNSQMIMLENPSTLLVN